MREPDRENNQFLRSIVTGVVHKSFARAIRHIGLPDFPRPLFIHEIKPYLHLEENSRLEDGESLTKLWRSTLQGEVIATDVRGDVPAFYVRSGFGTTGYVVRLVLVKGEWRVDSVVSVYERQLVHIPWIRRAAFSSAVTAAAVFGLFIVVHPPIAKPHILAESAAKSAVIGSAANGSPSGATAHHGAPAGARHATPTTAHPVANGSTASATTQHGTPATAGAPKIPQQTATVFRFHLASGMPLGNLSQFLYEQHLVGNAVTFDMLLKNTGIDKDVQPGTYIFKKGMKVSQMLQELKQGPPVS